MNFNLRGMFFLTHEIDRRMAATISENYRSLIFITSISATLGIDRAVGILRFKGCRCDDGRDLCGALPALGYPRFRSSPEDYRNINDKGCTGKITV